MNLGIDPKVDFACKRLLGNPDHPDLTIHFLNSVLRPESPITDVQILNPSIEKEYEGDKWSLLDIHATDELGRLYDIEVQNTKPLGLSKRLAYYTASLLVGQLGEGEEYFELRPAINICLLDAKQFPSVQPLPAL
ncbi:Rpn family recombination-promoting nuclease/putative transposase [Neorhodopirellula pilleata]|uniref:PD-(D/E)XK nuclease family transposase n=1 Tax=Neorhodopirellula pilleata TaxID=2714738 RepID=A0A5C6AQE7_9BACT|nr:Rpn family recombination-promoting nuclease/putative transposase [Neorhodopirellula pilleata]TWU01449.1 PD-(D/E)XK nuclease family transposase [Neorhodopirellula pilleata]